MADTVNLKKSYSALNEKLVKQFDGAGLRRSFTVPYIEGQSMADHIEAVNQAASPSGGLSGNLLLSAHHSTGKGWGSGDGHTVGHPSEKLRTTIIPKDDENAKATIGAAQTHLNGIAKLLGDDDPTVMTAQNQLQLIKKTDGQGMNLLDFGVMLTQLMHGPHQAVARAHSNTHPDGPSPHLRASRAEAPQPDQESQESPQGEAQTAETAPEGQEAPPEAPAAAVAAPAPQTA